MPRRGEEKRPAATTAAVELPMRGEVEAVGSDRAGAALGTASVAKATVRSGVLRLGGTVGVAAVSSTGSAAAALIRVV